ncbi:hypothetical protein CEP50_18455 [Actinopolyspora mortivallis]|uniref:DUF1152 domain-containing protein n=2 Tax=Actinopolyspora mortivallis TaxID=33906 RepID=A0A2T0GRY6_ACTMO|nr:hypothetical protein CEP50_18455 [Actinopolyspora mortivallis]
MNISLYIASGGSGDLISAIALSEARNDSALFSSVVWERASLDPHVGPRGMNDIFGLAKESERRLISGKSFIPGGWSPLPQLVEETGIPVFYLDATLGSTGVARQISDLCIAYSIDVVYLVDTGGDVIASGREPGLRSPAIDTLLLAACVESGMPSLVTVIGSGLDGELTSTELASAKKELAPYSEELLPDHIAGRTYSKLSWFPSEASLMTLLAVGGVHGAVDIKSGIDPVRLDEKCAIATNYRTNKVAARNRMVDSIRGSKNFIDVDSALVRFGCTSELSKERKYDINRKSRLIKTISKLDAEAIFDSVNTSATHISLRRIGEILGANKKSGLDSLDKILRSVLENDYLKPILHLDTFRHMSKNCFSGEEKE